MSLSYLTQTFQEFSQSTSLHGYSYLYIANTFISRLIWIAVILILSGIGILFLVVNTDEYLKYKIVTNIESSTSPLNVRS